MNNFKKLILPNGATIIIVPQKNSLTFTALVATRTGSKNETLDNNGISHLLEHMMFKGTTEYPSPKELSFALENIGSNYNAFTDKELTGYYIKGNIECLDESLQILSSLYCKPLLPGTELEREKSVIHEEIHMYHDDPARYVSDLFEYSLFQSHSLGYEIAGSKETLANISPDILHNYYHTHYIAQKTVIIIAGGVNEKQLIPLIKKYFIVSKSKNFSSETFTTPVIKKSPNISIHYRETKESHIKFGFPGIPDADPRHPTLLVLSGIFGQGMSSMLFSRVREAMGLCYYIFAEPGFYKETGYLAIQSGLNNEKLKHGVTETFNIIRDLKAGKFTPQDIERAKNFLVGNFLLSLESNSQLTHFYLRQAILGYKKFETPAEVAKKIHAVTRNDIVALASQLFQPQLLNIALIGPFKEQKEFNDLLTVRY